MIWYLAGPICHVSDNSDREWRNTAKRQLHYIDPFEVEEHLWPEYRLLGEKPKDTMNRLRAEGKIDLIRKLMQEVLALDKKSVERADGVLAYSPFPSWGTIREITLAYELGKPVVLWTPRHGTELSNTEIALSTVIVESLDEALRECKAIETTLNAAERLQVCLDRRMESQDNEVCGRDNNNFDRDDFDYEYLAHCQFECYSPYEPQPFDCGEPAVARVFWEDGTELFVCEEHLREIKAWK